MTSTAARHPRTAGEHIERLADQALKEHPVEITKVDVKYFIGGREATEQELQDLAVIEAEREQAEQNYVQHVLAVHQRAVGWIRLVDYLDRRARKLLPA